MRPIPHINDLELFQKHGEYHIGTIDRDPSGPSDKTSFFVITKQVFDALHAGRIPVTATLIPHTDQPEIWNMRIGGASIGRGSTQMLIDMARAFLVEMPEGEPDMLGDQIREATLKLIKLQEQVVAQGDVLAALYKRKNRRAADEQSPRAMALGNHSFHELTKPGVIGFDMRAADNTDRPELKCSILGVGFNWCTFLCENGNWSGKIVLEQSGRLTLTVDHADYDVHQDVCITAIHKREE